VGGPLDLSAMKTRGRWVVIAAGLLLVACQSLASGAKEQFSKDYSCPLDRIESRDRRDLHPSSFSYPLPMPKPPADVAADPARLALWTKNHTHDPTLYDGDNDIEEARGCGKQAFYQCHNRKFMSCMGVPTVPPGISHW
jgi:hypothetical protein